MGVSVASVTAARSLNGWQSTAQVNSVIMCVKQSIMLYAVLQMYTGTQEFELRSFEARWFHNRCGVLPHSLIV